VLFISYKDNLDPAQPNGRLFLGMLGCLAEYEKELIRECTISGLEEARRRGVKHGRRPVNFDLARAKEMRSAGLSVRVHSQGTGCRYGDDLCGPGFFLAHRTPVQSTPFSALMRSLSDRLAARDPG